MHGATTLGLGLQDIGAAGRASALDDLELYPPVNSIACVVPAGPNDQLARSPSGRDQAPAQLAGTSLKTVLHVSSTQDGEPIIDSREACGAGMADNFKARLVRNRALPN